MTSDEAEGRIPAEDDPTRTPPTDGEDEGRPEKETGAGAAVDEGAPDADKDGEATTGDGGEEKEDGKDEGAEENGRKKSGWRIVLETVVLLLVAAVIAILIQAFFIRAYAIPSSSMSPTLEINDRVMVEKVSYWFRDPHRKEIVVFRMYNAGGLSPAGPGAMTTTNPFYWPFEQIGEILRLTHGGTTPYVKRVVATGGETLELRKGILYVNGKKIDEPYAVKDGSDFGPYKVPKGYVFCMGDNRPNSRDSRSFGPVPVRSIIGRVFLRWWPLSRFTTPR